ncbi:MAG: hypothetical protein ACLRMZ_08755 [Blautia marasmi]
MLIENGKQQLLDFTEKNYKETITEVTKGCGLYQDWATAMQFLWRLRPV